MEKAYDFKDLENRLKGLLLPAAENATEGVYTQVKEWLTESAQISKTPFDDVVPLLISFVDAKIKDQLDKIDGQPG